MLGIAGIIILAINAIYVIYMGIKILSEYKKPSQKSIDKEWKYEKCNHESKYANWNDKFIPGWNDKTHQWELKEGQLPTKYWQIKCTNCNKYIPEYAFKYPPETFTKQ